MEEQQVFRVRVPRGREVIGMIEQRLGAGRMLVRCFDGHSRNCRVPGRLRRALWLREGDIVIVEPWENSMNDKGDVLHKYTQVGVEWLKRKGFIKIEREF